MPAGKRRSGPMIILIRFVGGLGIALLVAWGFTAFSTIPMYPRTTFRVFVADGRVCHVTEVNSVGYVDAWWSVVQEQSADPTKQAEMLRDKAKVGGVGRPAPHTTSKQPRWGTMK